MIKLRGQNFDMSLMILEARRVGSEWELDVTLMFEDILVDDDYYENGEAEMSEIQEDRRTADTSSWVHPLRFAKFITKAIDAQSDKNMDHPSNGVSVFGCLHSAFIDEESYLRRVFFEESNGYNSDWKDSEMSSFNPAPEERACTSTIYRMEIIHIELFSMYGVQSVIDLQDFQDAEPDVLVHSTSAILDHFSERGQRCNNALKAMCKKKGIYVEVIDSRSATILFSKDEMSDLSLLTLDKFSSYILAVLALTGVSIKKKSVAIG